MDSYEILATDVGIAKLVNVGYAGTRDCTGRTFASRVVTQTFLTLEYKDRLPHQPTVHADNSVRTIVVVNRRPMSWSPANHQHFDRLVTTNAVAPVIAFFESDVRFQVEIEDFNA